MKEFYLWDLMDSREILIPFKKSIIVGRGIQCNYRTLIRFDTIALEQFNLQHCEDDDLFLTNFDSRVSIYTGTAEEPFLNEIVNRERVHLGDYLTVGQNYQFRILSEKDFSKMSEDGILGRT